MNHIPLQILIQLEQLEKLDFNQEDQESQLNCGQTNLCLDYHKMHLQKRVSEEGKEFVVMNTKEKPYISLFDKYILQEFNKDDISIDQTQQAKSTSVKYKSDFSNRPFSICMSTENKESGGNAIKSSKQRVSNMNKDNLKGSSKIFKN